MDISARGRFEAAKAAVLHCMAGEPWLMGVGIGLVSDKPGVVVNVDSSGEEAARAILSEIDIDVPAIIRVVGHVRKR